MNTIERYDYTFTPTAWDALAEENDPGPISEPEDRFDNPQRMWFRQLADIQEVINLHVEEAADGITCHEQAINLRERLEPLLAGLEIIGREFDAWMMA